MMTTTATAAATTATPVASFITKLVLSTVLRGGNANIPTDLSLSVDASDWCANLAEPAALVGGAVLATLATTRQDLAPKKSDSYWRRRTKQTLRFLLLTAFGLEIASIFVTTVTSTMLLAHGDCFVKSASSIRKDYHSPMGFLSYHHEFEYLTARVAFLQGLFHWLLATALEMILPKEKEGEASKRMNVFIASTLVSVVLFM